ncbi:MAG: ABC transporter permease [Candidatus Bipolaricaulota bacterium]|nr:ABC transporter permease [Candidatus Bipolaricaulota bacterium]
MLGYVARRLVWMVVVLGGVTTITFFVARVIPADPVGAILGPQAPPEAIEREKERWGLDKPIYVQYARYMAGLLRGDLGRSLRTRRPVLEDIKQFFPATVELALAALLIGVVMGIGLGMVSAVRSGQPVDHASRVFAIVGLSMPAFWLGLLLLLVFYYRLGWLPGPGQLPYWLPRPPRVTGFLTIDAMLARDWTAFVSYLHHLVMPAFTLGWLSTASITRITRSSMLEVLREEYIKTARMKGLRENVVVMKHAFKNALLPVITVTGIRFASLLEGAVLTETVFAWPGLGRYATYSFLSIDFNAVVGTALFMALLYAMSNLIVDLLYAYLNPKIRYD